MNKGICVAGNMIVDILYPIERYPRVGELTTIGNNIQRSMGGLLCNCIADIAALAPDIPLKALGVIGDDAEGKLIEDLLGQYPSINMDMVAHEGTTSFTAVMNDTDGGTRTFFQFRGANALFSERHFDWEKLDVDMLHIGYILLLDALDEPDDEYGTKMARVLAEAQKRGIKTSIDVVSESGDRFQRLVTPALKYTDYCIINEIEAEKTTGIPLRDDNGIIVANMAKVLDKLFELGVGTWAVIHAQEGSFGRTADSEMVSLPSLHLPKGYIKGTTGAGDAFCSGVLTGAYKGMSLIESMELGTAAAVASLSAADATSGMMTIDKALERYRELRG